MKRVLCAGMLILGMIVLSAQRINAEECQFFTAIESPLRMVLCDANSITAAECRISAKKGMENLAMFGNGELSEDDTAYGSIQYARNEIKRADKAGAYTLDLKGRFPRLESRAKIFRNALFAVNGLEHYRGGRIDGIYHVDILIFRVKQAIRIADDANIKTDHLKKRLPKLIVQAKLYYAESSFGELIDFCLGRNTFFQNASSTIRCAENAIRDAKKAGADVSIIEAQLPGYKGDALFLERNRILSGNAF